jgi:hypothetical protein
MELTRFKSQHPGQIAEQLIGASSDLRIASNRIAITIGTDRALIRVTESAIPRFSIVIDFREPSKSRLEFDAIEWGSRVPPFILKIETGEALDACRRRDALESIAKIVVDQFRSAVHEGRIRFFVTGWESD